MLLRTWTESWRNVRRHIKQAPTPQHVKQEKERAEKRWEKRKLAACESGRKSWRMKIRVFPHHR